VFVAKNCHRWQRRWTICGRSISGRSGWRRRLRRSIRLLKVSSGDDRRAHHLKEIGRCGGEADPLGCTIQTRKSSAKRLHGSEVFEIVFRAITHVEEVDIRKRKVFYVPL